MSKGDISYRIQPAKPTAHLYEIKLTVRHPDPDGQVFRMPAWIPGSYMIRDFARNVVGISAQAGGKPVKLHKLDKDTWRCDPVSDELVLSYEVYAWDLSVRSAHLDGTHAYFNGTSVFLAVVGQEHLPCEVFIEPPPSPQYANWKVGTSLTPAPETREFDFGYYHALNYADLIEHPVEISDFSHARFDVAGVPHDIVLYGQHSADLERLAKDLQHICTHHVSMFGGLPDIPRYVFLIMAVGEGYGGLEHTASCSLICSRDDLPKRDTSTRNEKYRTFLGLCSHEYFHTWNVKQIKPDVFLPYDLSREAHTRQLWAFEGITSYYDDLGLLRSGRIDTAAYLELLGQMATRVWRGRGRFRQSVAESSFDAWTRFYKQDENSPNAIVSYYTKGALIAICLDLLIRRSTEARSSLDDVMRRLWKEYGAVAKGVPEGVIEDLVADAIGKELSENFFSRFLYGTEDLPMGEFLQDMGIRFCTRPSTGTRDMGGKAARDEDVFRTYLGIRSKDADLGINLLTVDEASPAQLAGLSANDNVIAVNGLKINTDKLDQLLRLAHPGDRMQIHAFRRDELMLFDITLAESVEEICYLEADENASDEVKARQANWLRGEN